MNDKNKTLDSFLAEVRTSQLLWALQDKVNKGWVVLDSLNFENTETLPVWSTKDLAQLHCVDEWQGYEPCEIALSDWFEFWLEDLKDDDVIVGINWQDNKECLELELGEFSQFLADVESLK